MTRTGSKILIVYYSHTGVTRGVAEKIREKTGGDVFELETVRTYPSQYSELIEEAKRELQKKDLPALKKDPPDMSSYDLVLVGGPVWWYTVSTPVMSFLKQADFAGKELPPFVPMREGSEKYSRISSSRPKMPLSLKASIYTSRKPGKARPTKPSIPGSASLRRIRERYSGIRKIKPS